MKQSLLAVTTALFGALLAVSTLTCCDGKLKVQEERTQEVDIPGVGKMKRFVVHREYGNDEIVYVFDKTQPVTLNRVEGKSHKTVIIVDGVEYEAKVK